MQQEREQLARLLGHAGWQTPSGSSILAGGSSFGELEAYVLANGETTRASGRQEFIENLINEFVL